MQQGLYNMKYLICLIILLAGCEKHTKYDYDKAIDRLEAEEAVSDPDHYTMKVRCQNCFDVNDVSLPVGMDMITYIPTKHCPNCKVQFTMDASIVYAK
jgi:rubrerythrin